MGLNIRSFVNSVFDHYATPTSQGGDGSISSAQRATTTGTIARCDLQMRYSNDLFVKADANRDGKLTPAELTKFVAGFDSNHDGQLNDRGWLAKLLGVGGPSELERFQQTYHEEEVPGSRSCD